MVVVQVIVICEFLRVHLIANVLEVYKIPIIHASFEGKDMKYKQAVCLLLGCMDILSFECHQKKAPGIVGIGHQKYVFQRYAIPIEVDSNSIPILANNDQYHASLLYLFVH